MCVFFFPEFGDFGDLLICIYFFDMYFASSGLAIAKNGGVVSEKICGLMAP